MVYIKRIDIRGFKTFHRKVSLKLDRGLTIITGPNGSGKSNIIDAVKFALGELSPKELRGSSFEDVISNLGEGEGLKSAYVAIQFDNADRRIAVDSDYVTISRQYVRGGEGVYRLNGKRVSRRQINDALSASGINVSGVNIIPQGTVTRLAEVTAEERRKIIEDMTGIGVFDEKKAEAKTHLQQAEINLKVASAKVDEVRSRVESLEKERNDLKRSRFLKEELKELQAKIISQRIRGVDREISTLLLDARTVQGAVESSKELREKLLDEKRTLEVEYGRLEEDKSNLTQELFRLERKIAESSIEAARVNMELQDTRRKIVELNRLRVEAIREKEELTEKKMGLERKVSELEKEKASLQRRREKLEEERNTLMEGIKDGRSLVYSLLVEVEKLDEELSQTAEQRASIESSLSLEERKIESLRSRLASAEGSLEEVVGESASLSERLQGLERELKEENGRLREVRNAVKEAESRAEHRREALKRSKAVLEKARFVQLRLEARKRALRDVRAEGEAYEVLMRMVKEGLLHGVKGKVRSMIKINPEFSLALEAASNGWFEAIIVEDLNAAISCMEALKKNKCGRLKIIPLSRIIFLKPLKLNVMTGDVVGRAVDIVKCEEDVKPALNFILGDTVMVKTGSAALFMSTLGYRAVTLEGDVFEPRGTIETGYRHDADLWNLDSEDSRNIETLAENLQKLISQREDELSKLNNNLAELRGKEIQIEGKVKTLEAKVKELRDAQAKLQSIRGETIRLLEKLKLELQESVERCSKLKEEEMGLESKIMGLESKKKELMQRVKATEITELEGRASELNASLYELDNRIHELEKNLAISNSDLAYVVRRLLELDEAIPRFVKEAEEAEESVNKLQGSKAIRSGEVSQLNEMKNRLTEEVLSIDGRKRSVMERLREVEERLQSVFKSLEEKTAELSRVKELLKEREIEKTFLIRDLRNLGFATPLETEDVEVDKTQEVMAQLNKELDEIGAVNELAEQQYAEYMKNYKQLSTKINELEEEKIAILRFMAELDQKKKAAFLDAFKKVERNFSEIFSKITGGGVGRLILENVEDPFSGGVEVKLAFPGKREFSISGASGGEKSVATVCFIIALQVIQPMPFYMFDEIDAHLDPLNAQRLADLLKERSKGCQFVIISLKDTTISRGDRVYGVYIEKGASRIVSLPIPEMVV
ncbi:MAG: chromosome segregation protein SMC [Candidatus Bathyarchaeia archaeon]